MRCQCKSKSREVKQIGSWDHCPLEGNGHTSFVVFRCSNCGGVDGFPSENLDIALREGTLETKKKLDEIINSNKEQL